MITVIYIAGYGRSGSTLLDLLLGAHAEVQSLGEAGMVLEQLHDPESRCSCGERLVECGVWGPVLKQDGNPPNVGVARRDAIAQEHWLGRLRAWSGKTAAYRQWQESLLKRLQRQSGAAHFVDSSKTAYRFAWRPRALAECSGLEVRILHLIRHPASVLTSTLKGRNSRLALGQPDRRTLEVPTTLIGWNLANLFAALNGKRLGAERYLRVDFDELLDSPEIQFGRIGQFLGLDLTDVASLVRDRRDIPDGHLIAANRVARSSAVRVATDRAHPASGFFQRFAVKVFCTPLYRLLKAGAAVRTHA